MKVQKLMVALAALLGSQAFAGEIVTVIPPQGTPQRAPLESCLREQIRALHLGQIGAVLEIPTHEVFYSSEPAFLNLTFVSKDANGERVRWFLRLKTEDNSHWWLASYSNGMTGWHAEAPVAQYASFLDRDDLREVGQVDVSPCAQYWAP